MDPFYGSAMLHGITHRFTEGDGSGGGDGGAGGAGGGDDQIDAEAAKAALAIVDKMKAAGVEDPEGALDLISKLREFEKGTKLPKAVEKKIADLESQVKDADGASKSEAQKLADELESLKKQLEQTASTGQTRVAKAAIKAAAAAAGAGRPDVVSRLIDPEDVDFDDDGEPTNVDKLVAQIKKSTPELFSVRKPGSGDGGPRGAAAGDKKPSMDDAFRAAAGR